MRTSRPSATADTRHLASVLADCRHRRILSVLASRRDPLGAPEIAVRLAAIEADESGTAITDSALQSLEVMLHHQYLPKLEATGLLTSSSSGYRLVTPFPVDIAAYDVPVPPADDPADPAWDLLAAVVARPYRRDVLDAVAAEPGSLSVARLVDRVLAASDGTASDSAFAGRRRLIAKLHHVDLPSLAALGLVEYRADERRVAATPVLTSVL